jgi:hypothetical protein
MALDPDASVAELRQMKISFLHQSFQEYLTAKWYLSSLHPQLPPDVSHDAFWREVPIYIIQSYSHPTDQQEFALSFLLGDNPDYFTASRLVNEITDPGIRRIVEKRVVELLLQDIERPYVYAYAIDTFDSLGQAGKEALRASLGDTSRLSMIHAGAEVHLADRTVEGADETSWRALGRSIYILGELGDAWLAGHLAACVGSVRSLHLLYHIAEALLTLSRISDPPEQLREIILSAVTTLSQVSGGDPVIRAYAYATVAPWSDAVDLRRECAEELRAFLMGQTDTSREHFPHEFWRRAHGVEAFVEVAEPDIASEVLTKLFRAENTADYRGYEDGDFRKVHSSILKAMLRSGDLHSETHFGWRSLLELLFESNRISSNAWACRHLERLLVRWFRSSEDIAWIRGWRDSQKIGGVQIGTVLSNVIWSSS